MRLQRINLVKNKVVFLDRDGTINVEKNYLYKIEDFEFLPGVKIALKILQEAGYLLVIVTNQSGIGRGYYTEDDFSKLNHWMEDELKKDGIIINKVYYCPHFPEAKIEKYRKDCDCRKPALGMYIRAEEELKIDLSGSYAVGDKIRDCAICDLTKCKGYLLANNERNEIIQDVKDGKLRNVEYASNLLEFAKKIVRGDMK